MKKLQYMHRIGETLGDADPLRKRGRPDMTVDEMDDDGRRVL